MNPRDDERRKFEAWVEKRFGVKTLRMDEDGDYLDRGIRCAWQYALARAEQSETPRAAQTRDELEKEWLAQTEWQDFTNWLIHVKLGYVSVENCPGPSCVLCGAAMEFKCLSCGSTPAPTEPSQAQTETPSTAQHCRNCGLRLAVLDGITVHRETLREKCPTMGNMIGSTNTRAAAPVEDRPDKICDKCGQVHMEGICCVGDRPAPDPFSKGYKHRNGGPVSDACGEGKHAECTQDYTKCHCTYRGLHKIMHAYMTSPDRRVAPEKD